MNTLIKKVEAKYSKENLPEVRIGDTVKAVLKVVEGQKERLQTFEGVIIAEKGEGINKNITIRKISFGVGVEKTIPLNSPKLDKVEVVKKGRVRRAKLYYFRERVGRALSRIKIRKD